MCVEFGIGTESGTAEPGVIGYVVKGNVAEPGDNMLLRRGGYCFGAKVRVAPKRGPGISGVDVECKLLLL